VAFPLAAAIALAIPFVKSGSRRNYFFVAVLLLMSVAELAVHLDHLHLAKLPGWLGVQIALDLVLFVMSVMAGRVIPMFTNNGSREQGRRACRWWTRRRWAWCWYCWRRTLSGCTAHQWCCWRSRRPPPTWCDGSRGVRGKRSAHRSSGCFISRMAGFPCISRCARWPNWVGFPRPQPSTR
jgi:hypothetical protein